MQKDTVFAMRHSAAHVLAAAVKQLYPEAQFGVGPVVENGFYYDVKTDTQISEDDLVRIEKKMREIINQKHEMKREELSIPEAIELFEELNQPFKVELLDALRTKGTTKMSAEEAMDVDAGATSATIYRTGEFVDLCRGPHVLNTKEIGAFTLTKVAGAYWRGNSEQAQLTRVYGLCFETKEELSAHLAMLEEARKRDHRKLGKELGLFVFSDLVGPGLPLWTPRGTVLRDLLNDFVWQLRKRHGYQRVTIPHITKKELYETSGHWAKYAEDLFKIETRDGHIFAMKPMNCPHHTQIYDSQQRSYRELPVRYAETTMVYRDEQSGELSGLSRVLSITQDDAHVFCRVSQIREEAESVWQIIQAFYGAFGFELKPRLSRRDPENPDKYLGSPEDWAQAEQALQDILDEKGAEWIDGPGEAAFYGPKIDFMAKDSIGRQWQVATIQLDFNQPKNFGLTCVNEKGEREQIVMLHVAIMGSIERFLATLIEHLAGAFPLWLAPEQVRLAPVSDAFNAFAQDLAARMRAADIRVMVDESAEKVGKKVRDAAMQKVPWTIVIGQKEVDGGDLQITVFGSEEKKGIAQSDLLEEIKRATAH